MDTFDSDADDFGPESDSRAQKLTVLPDAGDAGERIDKVLSKHLSDYSRSRIQKWITDGAVSVNGEMVTSVRLSVPFGSEISVIPEADPEETSFSPEDVPFDVVYEDDTVIVVNKHAGLVVHPAAGNWSGTLLNGLLHRYPGNAGVPRAGIVHRLDKDTTGLLVVARTIEAQTSLVRQLQARTVSRRYLALVWGEVPEKFLIDENIGRHPRERTKMAVLKTNSGKEAITHVQLLDEGMIGSLPVSLVSCRLETGRTHQIRVHMQHVGHPLVGDAVYGQSRFKSVFPRQALHAARLSLEHPASGKTVSFSAGLPDDMRELLETAGIATGSGDD